MSSRTLSLTSLFHSQYEDTNNRIASVPQYNYGRIRKAVKKSLQKRGGGRQEKSHRKNPTQSRPSPVRSGATTTHPRKINPPFAVSKRRNYASNQNHGNRQRAYTASVRAKKTTHRVSTIPQPTIAPFLVYCSLGTVWRCRCYCGGATAIPLPLLLNPPFGREGRQGQTRFHLFSPPPSLPLTQTGYKSSSTNSHRALSSPLNENLAKGSR